jgi:hypothetical protein
VGSPASLYAVVSPVWRLRSAHGKRGTHTGRSVCDRPGMTTDISGRLRSALGENLIVLLVIAMVMLGALISVPSLMAQSAGTATKAQERVNLPLTIAAELDQTP